MGGLSCLVLETGRPPHWSLMLGVCLLWEHVYIDKTGPLQLPHPGFIRTRAEGPTGRMALGAGTEPSPGGQGEGWHGLAGSRPAS